MSEKISRLRKTILDIDTRIVRLLCRRMKIVQRIAKLKRSEGISVVDTVREQQVLDHVTSLPHDPIQIGHLLELYENIIRISRETQSEFLRDILEYDNDRCNAGKCYGKPNPGNNRQTKKDGLRRTPR